MKRFLSGSVTNAIKFVDNSNNSVRRLSGFRIILSYYNLNFFTKTISENSDRSC